MKMNIYGKGSSLQGAAQWKSTCVVHVRSWVQLSPKQSSPLRLYPRLRPEGLVATSPAPGVGTFPATVKSVHFPS